MPLVVKPAAGIDPCILADMRVTAMRPSLEAVGRFDPERARTRFLSTYVNDDTWLIFHKTRLIGFYVLRDRGDHVYLDHLYVDPQNQGTGTGRRIMRQIQALNRSIRLIALKGSPANAFYVSCGFKATSEDAFDIQYLWTPPAP